MTFSDGLPLTPEKGSLITLYDESFRPIGVLRRAYNIILNDERVTRTTGAEQLKFSILNDSPYYDDIYVERLIEFGGRWFRIKLLEDTYYKNRGSSVSCDALWYELGDGGRMPCNYENTTIAGMLSDQFRGLDVSWVLPTDVQSINVRSVTKDMNSRLHNLRYILRQYNLEVVFGYRRHDKGVTIVIFPQVYQMTKKDFPLVVGKSVSSITRTVDSRNLCTRYTLTSTDDNGDEITIADINGGKSYLDDTSYFRRIGAPERIIEKSKDDNRYRNKWEMMEAMREHLRIYSSPFVSYDVDAALYSHEQLPDLLESQLILDEKYEITEWRIVTKRKINFSNLTKSVISFQDPRADTTSQAQDMQDLRNIVSTESNMNSSRQRGMIAKTDKTNRTVAQNDKNAQAREKQVADNAAEANRQEQVTRQNQINQAVNYTTDVETRAVSRHNSEVAARQAADNAIRNLAQAAHNNLASFIQGDFSALRNRVGALEARVGAVERRGK